MEGSARRDALEGEAYAAVMEVWNKAEKGDDIDAGNRAFSRAKKVLEMLANSAPNDEEEDALKAFLEELEPQSRLLNNLSSAAGGRSESADVDERLRQMLDSELAERAKEAEARGVRAGWRGCEAGVMDYRASVSLQEAEQARHQASALPDRRVDARAGLLRKRHRLIAEAKSLVRKAIEANGDEADDRSLAEMLAAETALAGAAAEAEIEAGKAEIARQERDKQRRKTSPETDAALAQAYQALAAAYERLKEAATDATESAWSDRFDISQLQQAQKEAEAGRASSLSLRAILLAEACLAAGRPREAYLLARSAKGEKGLEARAERVEIDAKADSALAETWAPAEFSAGEVSLAPGRESLEEVLQEFKPMAGKRSGGKPMISKLPPRIDPPLAPPLLLDVAINHVSFPDLSHVARSQRRGLKGLFGL